MEVERVDLNLLRVFHQIMRLRSVSAAALALGLSQPAVSAALKRLRELTHDELFLRTARGVQPTARAEELAGPIAAGVEALHQALARPAHFVPALARLRFRLSLTDIGEIYFLPALLHRLDEQAPGVDLSIARIDRQGLRDQLESGGVDAAIGLLPQLQGKIYRQRLFRQQYVLVMRRRHPLARRQRISVAGFSAAEHLQVTAEGTGHGEVDRLLAQRGIARRVRLSVPHFMTVGHILAASDLVATLPERLAARIVEPFGLCSRPHPVRLQASSIDLFWHARRHRDPAHQWLRQQLVSLFAEGASGKR